MRDATRIIRSTLSPAVAGEPMHHGPVFAAPFHTPGDPAAAPYSYARSHNPTWTALEAAIAGLESGPEAERMAGSEAGATVDDGSFAARALVFGSGMAAVAAVFGAVLRAGDVVVLPSDAYYAARVLVEEQFVPRGVTVRTVPTAGMARAGREGLFEGARLVWVETPSNPTMEVADIRAVCEAARAAGTGDRRPLVAVDNTTATPLGQSPLELGADFSMCSDTKLMTGHGDLLLGHVAVRAGAQDRDGAELYEKLLGWRTQVGAVVGPMEAWLALRSLATLPLRAERSSANALAMAGFLKGRPGVAEVRYPGLPSDPGYAVASGQMRLFGPVLSFVLKDREAAEQFLQRSELITVATSFGGIVTTAERRARWGHDRVPEGLLRLSAGCEAIEDLLEDMGRALEGLG